MPRETKQILLQNGLELIFKKGYNNTGIQEILVASGVPKGSFYHFFKNKEDFGIQVLEFYGRQSKSMLAEVLGNGEHPPLTRLRNFFDAGCKHMAENRRGCLVGNMTQEMGSLSAAFEACLEEKWCTVRSYLSQCLSQAKQTGEILNEEEPEQLADFLINGWQGAMMRVKVAGDIQPLHNYIKVVFGSLLRTNLEPATV